MYFGNLPAVKTFAFLLVFLINFAGSCYYYFENRVMVCPHSNPRLHNYYFQNICYLYTAIFSRTELEIIELGAFNCVDENLSHLDVSRNRIRDLHHYTFRGLKKLKHLDFSYNQIEILPAGIFDDLVNLETIYGHSNSIKSFTSGIFHNLINLQEIRFDSNYLESLEKRLFTNLTRLLHLNLNHNKLKTFDGILPQHRKIQTTEVAYGDIEKLKSSWQNRIEIHVEGNAIESADFHIPDYVSFLGLKGNRLSKFPTAVRSHSESTSDFKVTLSNNLWLCDCSALPLRTFLVEHRDKVADIDEVTCKIPHNTTAVVANLRSVDLCISTTVLAVGVTITCVVMVTLIVCYVKNCCPFSTVGTDCKSCHKSDSTDSVNLVVEKKSKFQSEKQLQRF